MYKEIFGDFRNFLFYVWTRHLKLPEPTPVQYSIAEWIEHGPRRKIEMGYRGIGKSWITSAYVCYRLGKYYLTKQKGPEPKFLVVSASKQRADDFSIFTMQILGLVPELNFLLPKKDQRQSKIAFDVGPAGPSHAPTVKSVGIFGQLTGSRATDVIADDVEVANNAATPDMRDKLFNACLEFESIIVPDVGTISYLGTPQTEESIYNKLRERGYACRIHPALYPTEAQVAGYRGALDPYLAQALEKSSYKLVGSPTDPTRFSLEDLANRKLVYGTSGFNLQFMLDTTLSDAERYPLKTSDFVVMELNPDRAPVTIQYTSAKDHALPLASPGFSGDRWYRPLYISPELAPYEGVVMAIDPSGRGTDETGYAVGAQLNGRIHVPAAGGLKGGYSEETLERLATIAREWKVNTIVVEANFGDGMFSELFKPVLRKVYGGCKVEEVRSTIQKERRIIDTLEPLLNQHRIVVDPRVIEEDLVVLRDEPKYSLFYQLTHITKDRGSLAKDDRLDALALMAAHWTGAMARSAEEAAKAWKEHQQEESLREFLEGIMIDGPPKSKESFVEQMGLRG